jgi:hypothetical protein
MTVAKIAENRPFIEPTHLRITLPPQGLNALIAQLLPDIRQRTSVEQNWAFYP